MLCACSFDPGGFTSPGGGDVDADVSPADDADPTAPDAEPGAPDAEPDAPDAEGPPPDAAPVLRTVVFRDGVDGYGGTRDTTLRESESSALHGSDEVIGWDMVSGASPEGRDFGLLKFEGITGLGGDAIPTGATIVSATLSLMIVDEGAPPSGSLHESAVDWSELSSWDSFGLFPGVQAEEIGDFVGELPTATGTATLDVTSSIARWVTDPIGFENRGWIFVPDNSNGVEARSRETGVADERPMLTVEYYDP